MRPSSPTHELLSEWNFFLSINGERGRERKREGGFSQSGIHETFVSTRAL